MLISVVLGLFVGVFIGVAFVAIYNYLSWEQKNEKNKERRKPG